MTLESLHEYFPDGALGLYVQRMVHARFVAPFVPERISPDSYIRLTFILTGAATYQDHAGTQLPWFDGFSGHISPEKGVLIGGVPPVRVLWLTFYPSGFHRLFGVPTNSLNDRMVGAEVYLGQPAFRLRAHLEEAADPKRAFAMVSELLLERIARSGLTEPDNMQLAEQHLRKENGKTAITELAAVSGMSVRQLQRRSPIVYGLSPKAFAAVIRFNKVYGAMQRNRTLDLDVALECGYYDESHMMKDLTYYLGKAPRRFATMERPLLNNNLGH